MNGPQRLSLRGDLAARVRAIAAHFDVTPEFVDGYLRPRDDIRTAVAAATSEVDLFERLGPLGEMYVRYAFSTTQRGRAFVEFIAPYARPRRFLDVGCAYGGFLRAWRDRGAEVVGIEIEPEFSQLARANLLGGAGEVLQGDILASDAMQLGAFDLVACNDVIEHVEDARRLIARVKSLLAPAGTAFFEIPNPDAVAFVRSDGHFQQFGLTLLPRALAERYLHEATGRSYREMGHMHDEAAYLRWFAEAGLAVIDCPQPHAQPFSQVHDQAFELVNAFTWWHGHQRAALSAEIADSVTDRYWTYAGAFFSAAERARKGIGRAAFERRYLAPFWTFIVRRR